MAYSIAINADRVATTIRDRDHKSLRNQLNRAAMSIAANIVEGRAKNSDKDFARFLDYAFGSASELEHHAMIARDVGAISDADCSLLVSQIVEVKKMLYGLIRRLRRQE